MEGAGPREELVEGARDLLAGNGIGMGEKDRRVWLASVVGGDPIEIALAVRGKAEALAPPVLGQIDSKFLAFEIERKKGLDPFCWILRLSGVLRVGCRAADFDLLGEDGLVIVVEGNETLREKGADFLLDLRSIGMDEAAAERVARCLCLFGSQAVAELVQKPARPVDGDEQEEGDDKGAEGLEEEGLHFRMILQGETLEGRRRMERGRSAPLPENSP